VIERDPAIAALDKAFSTLLVSSEGVNRAPRAAGGMQSGAKLAPRDHRETGAMTGILGGGGSLAQTPLIGQKS